MSYSNTAQSVSTYRPSTHSANAYHDTKITAPREGVVVQVGPAENYCSTLMVYVYQTKETMKVQANVSPNASINGVGTFHPYYPGDRVLIGYLFGFDSRPMVINRMSNQHGLAEELLSSEDYNLPQPNTRNPSGYRMHPSPASTILEASQWLGFTTVNAYPLFLP